MFWNVVALSVAVSFIFSTIASAQAGIVYLDASSSMNVSVHVDLAEPTTELAGYSLTISKVNGAIIQIVAVSGESPPARTSVSLGSRHGCLWGAFNPQQGGYVGGCGFSHGNLNAQFEMAWNGKPLNADSPVSASSVGVLSMLFDGTGHSSLTKPRLATSIGAKGSKVLVVLSFNASVGTYSPRNSLGLSPPTASPWFGASIQV